MILTSFVNFVIQIDWQTNILDKPPLAIYEEL